ncbi:Tetratricopeptide repeat-containing protein [Reichenbachiella agariperforans]|uniref:histidine kinase n=1 Tax=Reichenbachiella agariperforans TaxID=156994 RepID=A0A1M6W9R3_REIAG|nr:tetratricopeptide repeat protein [Reichenbachiella agariperforans]SHK90437.1 Tetratricopeptide repeat-containing protein [Reichenbachiella agariperforans]
MLKYLLTWISYSVITSSVCAFSNNSDSLNLILKNISGDSTTVIWLNGLAQATYRNDTDSALWYAEHALHIAKQINYAIGEAESYRRMGLIYKNQGNSNRALELLLQSKSIYQQIGLTSEMALLDNNIGGVYRRLGQYPHALSHYLESIQVAKLSQNQRLESMVYNNLGILYKHVGMYDSAMTNYYKSIEIKKKIDPQSLGSSYTNLGMIKLLLKNYEEAEQYFAIALKLDLEQNDGWGKANTYENLGMVHLEKQQYDQAQHYFEQALEGFTTIKAQKDVAVILSLMGKTQNKRGHYSDAIPLLIEAQKTFKETKSPLETSRTWHELAQSQFGLKQFDEALMSIKNALSIAEQIGALKEAVQAYELLYQIYGTLEDGERTYQYAQRYISMKDSLFNQEQVEYIALLESQNQISKVEQENLLLLKENQLRDTQLEASNLKILRQNAIQWTLITCLIFAVVVAGFSYYFYNRRVKTIQLLQILNSEINQQKEQIASQAEELTKVNSEMKHMNGSLEVLVQERTQKIETQNKKLRDYAFANSHEVRAPLANLLGLINLTQKNNMTPEDLQVILDKVHSQAIDLDHIITKVNKLLEEEKL